MLKINNEKYEKVSFGSLKVGDIFVDPEDNDVCIKTNDYSDGDNSFSFDMCVPFAKDNLDEVIPVHEATLTIK